ncbi:hypothetical protein D3C87_1537550 [compost metagenome]
MFQCLFRRHTHWNEVSYDTHFTLKVGPVREITLRNILGWREELSALALIHQWNRRQSLWQSRLASHADKLDVINKRRTICEQPRTWQCRMEIRFLHSKCAVGFSIVQIFVDLLQRTFHLRPLFHGLTKIRSHVSGLHSRFQITADNTQLTIKTLRL